MKRLAKFLSVILSLALILSLSPMAFADSSSGKGWTIMIYMCGSDLESEGGFATSDIDEILNSNYSDDVTVLIETGGSNSWDNDVIASNAIERYVRTEDGIECVDTQSDASMGNRNTLESFLKWGAENYPSEHMALVFWNHGGGSISGVCFDEKNDYESLSLLDIGTALQNTSKYYPNGFEVIGFDACLMATIETANTLAPYANYMYASEELEPGTGWDYTALLTYLAKNPSSDGNKLGSIQCESYYEISQQDGYDPSITFSIIDLSKMDKLNEAFDAVAKELYESEEFANIVRAVIKSDSFGSNNKSEGYTNMVDLGDIFNNVSKYAPSSKDALKALNEAVVYSVNGDQHKNAGGLSVYYPLSIQGTEEISIFTDLCKSTYYLAIVDKLAEGADLSVSDSGTSSIEESSSLSIADVYVDDDGIYTVELDNMDEFAYASCSIYLEDGEGGYIYLGEDDDVIIDYDSYIITDNFDGSWLSIDGITMPIELVAQYEDISLYSCSILLNGEETNLRLMYDWDAGEISIIGTWEGIDPNSNMAGRFSPDLEEGDIINFVYVYYDEDGNEDYFISDDIEYSDDLEIYYAELPAGDYDYCINLYDIYGNCYYLDFTTFCVEEDGSISFYID